MMELAGGVAGYLMQKDIDNILKTRMEALMLEYNKNTEITSSWNALQYDVSNVIVLFVIYEKIPGYASKGQSLGNLV